jgi:hypothetical protein
MKKLFLIIILIIIPTFSFAGTDTWGFTTSQKDGILLQTDGSGAGIDTNINVLTGSNDIDPFVVSQGGSWGSLSNGPGNCPDKPAGSVANVFNFATCLISKSLIPLVIAIAFVFFVWNAISYLNNPAKSEKRAEAAEYMLWSVIAFTVMVTIFGIVGIIINTIN